jgi:hypothetical protein
MKQQFAVTWKMSEEARERALIETGQDPGEEHTFTISLPDLNPEQRKPIVERLFPAHAHIEASSISRFDPNNHFNYLEKTIRYYDEQPSLDTIASVAASQIEEIHKADAHKAKIAARKEAKRKHKTQLYNRIRPQVEELIDAGNYEDLATFLQEHEDAQSIKDFSPIGNDSLDKIITLGMLQLRKERWQAQMDAWAMEHGSQHLQDCLSQGYHCERIYVVERCRQEWPGWTVDFYNKADWDQRTNPSHRALQLEKDFMDNHDVKIVWLTHPPLNAPDDRHQDAFKPHEALVIREYLGKYDLIRAMSEF